MILDKIVAEKKKRIEERKLKISLEDIRDEAYKLIDNTEENKFKNALRKDGLSIIGEFKKASPSKGLIVSEFNVEEIAKLYKELNIDAFSVLTEEDFFLGSDEYLSKVKTLSNKPILRKDFIIDFYQIYEAKVLGASGILLIVAELKDKLNDFYDECIKFKLEPLIEVHNKEELDIALKCGGEIIGINNRNLKNFNTTLETTEKLISYIPSDKIIVSESGIHNVEDLKKVKSYGADAVLVGEMFMRNIKNKTFMEEIKRFREKNNAN